MTRAALAPTLPTASDSALVIVMDWKVLIGIIVVAAVGGWLIVRAMTPSPPRATAPHAALPINPPALPEGRVTSVDRTRASRPGDERAGGASAAGDELDRDLAALAAALSDDQAIQYYVFTNRGRGGAMPPTTRYRHMRPFWHGATTEVVR